MHDVQVEGLTEYGDSRDRVKHFTFDYCYDSNAQLSPGADYTTQEMVRARGIDCFNLCSLNLIGFSRDRE